MIMAPVGNVISSIVIFLLLLHSLRHIIVRGEHQLNLEGIFAKQTICSESKVLDNRSVKIVHAYGPCSPMRQQPPMITEMLARDSLRQAHLHGRVWPQAVGADNHSSGGAARLGQSAATARVPVTDILLIANFGYMVPIYVGTPERLMHVILNTGNDFCWIQCEPCIHCYWQREPIFNPALSSSFRYEPCINPGCNHHPVVGSGGVNTNCDHGRCSYRVVYKGHSRTSGLVARDRVALVGAAFLGDFFFGCGNDNVGHFAGTAGVLSLGNTALSLNKQMSHMGNIFSYCLPSTFYDSGYLTLGNGPYPQAFYTPIVTEPNQPFQIFIHMWAMSVNNLLLPVPEGLFPGTKTIIDSGTFMGYIPQLAYNFLRTAIRNSMLQYRHLPTPFAHMDTCYDLSNVTVVDYPIVTLHLRNAEIQLGFFQTFFNHPRNPSIYCLGYAANHLAEGPSIIGAMQQRGLEVIYDLGQNRIGFSTIITNCH